MSRVIFSMFIVSMVGTLLACRGPRNFINDNDHLRRTNLELEQQVSELQSAIKQRVATIDALEQQIQQQTDQTHTNIDPSAAPRLTRVTFGRYSGIIDTNDDQRDDTLRLYIQTLDQDGRFYPVHATAVLQAVLITSDAAPQQILKKNYNTQQFADAYRSGFTGTHFTFETPLPKLDSLHDSFTVQISITDRSTGVTVNQQMTVRVKR